MELLLKLCIPSPGQPKEPKGPPPRPIEDEVREMLDLVNSQEESLIEWKALKRFYSDLCKRPQTPRIHNLREMIKPTLARYGFHVE